MASPIQSINADAVGVERSSVLCAFAKENSLPENGNNRDVVNDSIIPFMMFLNLDVHVNQEHGFINKMFHDKGYEADLILQIALYAPVDEIAVCFSSMLKTVRMMPVPLYPRSCSSEDISNTQSLSSDGWGGEGNDEDEDKEMIIFPCREVIIPSCRCEDDVISFLYDDSDIDDEDCHPPSTIETLRFCLDDWKEDLVDWDVGSASDSELSESNE